MRGANQSLSHNVFSKTYHTYIRLESQLAADQTKKFKYKINVFSSLKQDYKFGVKLIIIIIIIITIIIARGLGYFYVNIKS